MIDYIETKGPDGTKIRIEVEPGSKTTAGFTRQAAAVDVSGDEAKNAYNQMLTTIRTCANGVIDTLQNLEAVPSAASVTFAIRVDAEAGAMIAKSMNEAQFKVALSWKQDQADQEKEEKEKEE